MTIVVIIEVHRHAMILGQVTIQTIIVPVLAMCLPGTHMNLVDLIEGHLRLMTDMHTPLTLGVLGHPLQELGMTMKGCLLRGKLLSAF